jgi:phosphoglycerol transferase MdoB-like AlkP superfamily enzyme
MTGSESLFSEGRQHLLTRLLQLVLVGIVAVGLATLRLGMAANGAFGLAITLVPAAVRREYNYAMSPVLVLWITAAVSLHSVGSLGPYSWFPWYDSVTHTVSATVVAGLGYATFRGFERHSEELHVPPRFRPGFVVVFVLAVSVVWELVEFGAGLAPALLGIDAPLVVYGVDDIVSDVMFNTVGGLLVAAGGSRYIAPLAGFFRRRFDAWDP